MRPSIPRCSKSLCLTQRRKGAEGAIVGVRLGRAGLFGERASSLLLVEERCRLSCRGPSHEISKSCRCCRHCALCSSGIGRRAWSGEGQEGGGSEAAAGYGERQLRTA